MSTDSHSPIGIFDSGIGGLTVVKAVTETLPNEKVIYFGDTARVPYGIKSPDTVRRYALEITDFLLSKKVKMVLIACNTVSATARREIVKRAYPVPVLDVITAGVSTALEVPVNSNHLAVIGTLATIGSKAYQKMLKQRRRDAVVHAKACPLLVPLAEEGWIDHPVARETLREYLSVFNDKSIDSLILGCTHYPLFKEAIRQTLGHKQTQIIDSADAIANMARSSLAKDKLLNGSKQVSFQFYVSDRPQRFKELAQRFLGRRMPPVSIINLDN